MAQAESILRRGNGAEPETLDPAKMESVQANHILSDLFEPLVTLDPADRPVPAAAANWQISKDGLTYLFHLRNDLKWSDGSPLTASDYVYSLRRVLDPKNGGVNAYLLYPIKHAREIAEGQISDFKQLGVDAPDPLTLRFTLEHPTPYWVTLTSHGIFSPVQRAGVEKYGEHFTDAGNLVSNGPFMLQDWVPNSRVVLVKNPNYRDAAHVRLDRVIFFPIQSELEEFSRYRAGDLDVTNYVPSQQIDLIRANMGSELRSEPSLTQDYIGFNLQGPPFAGNPRLRQALSMAIDRQYLVDKILKTGAPASYSVLPTAGLIDYTDQPPDWAWLPTDEKIAKAQQLYYEAGYSKDRPLQIELYIVNSDNARKVANAVVAVWQQALGVKISLVAESFDWLLAHRHLNPQVKLFWYGWIGDYPDAASYLDLFVSKSAANDFGYNNPAFDRLVAEAQSMTDPLYRANLMQEAEALLSADTAIIPIDNRVNPYLVKPWVKGFHSNPCGYVYDKEVTILDH